MNWAMKSGTPKMAGEVRSYKQARAFLDGKERRKIANNTYVEELSRYKVAIRFHDTHIVIFSKNGNVHLDSGGWITMITRSRIAKFLPKGYDIFAAHGTWYLTRRRKSAYSQGLAHLFQDQMYISENAGPSTPKVDMKEAARDYRRTLRERRAQEREMNQMDIQEWQERGQEECPRCGDDCQIADCEDPCSDEEAAKLLSARRKLRRLYRDPGTSTDYVPSFAKHSTSAANT